MNVMLTKDSWIIRFINKHHKYKSLYGEITACDFIVTLSELCISLFFKALMCSVVAGVAWFFLVCSVQNVYYIYDFPQEWFLELPKKMQDIMITFGFIINLIVMLLTSLFVGHKICNLFKIDLGH